MKWRNSGVKWEKMVEGDETKRESSDKNMNRKEEDEHEQTLNEEVARTETESSQGCKQ